MRELEAFSARSAPSNTVASHLNLLPSTRLSVSLTLNESDKTDDVF
jgi:hypothetical protein